MRRSVPAQRFLGVVEVLLVGALLVASGTKLAGAVDGVIEINQARALAGGITPGDTAGFPVVLSEPGSYRLTGNLDPTSIEETAISIESSNVTLDLNGFAITGQASCSGTPGVMTCVFSGSGDGIVSPPLLLVSDVVIRNGTLRRLRVGILLEGAAIRIEGVSVRRCSGSGIVLNAAAAVVSGSTVTLNRGEGIDTSLDSRVFRNTSTGNNGVGINVGQFSLVRENTVTANGGFGIAAPEGALVIGNTVADNNGVGLSLVGDPGFVNNVLSGNGEPQVNGGVQLGTNLCDGAPCP